MTKVLKELIDGTVAEFDTDLYSPEVIDRYVADFNSKYQPPSPVPTGETSAPSVTGLPNIDPSELDTGLTWLGKQAGAAVQGTGRGFAGLGDIAISGVNAAHTAVTNPIRQLFGMEQKPAGFVWPLTETYDEYAPAAPIGYEETADWGQLLGPIAVTELASGGMATPEALAAMRGASFMPKLTKAVTTGLVKPLAKTPVIAATGVAGGEFGGRLAKGAGYGEDAQTLATLIGSAVAPAAAMPAVKSLANKLTMDASSRGKIELLKRQGIPPTFGDVGTKGVSHLQDVTGRGVFGGGPAFEARAELFRRIEQAIIDNVAATRGRSSGVPEPSTGQITKESIGAEAAHAARTGIANAEALKKQIQEELLRDIGPGTSVDPTPFYDRMDNLFSKVHDAGLRDQLRAIVADFDRNMPAPSSYTPPTIDPRTGLPIAGTARGTVSTDQPSYKAVQERSSEVGRTVDQHGRSYNKGFTKQAYGGMRDAMEETAQKQGVNDFNRRQDATEQLYTDIEGMEPTAEASGSGAAFDSLFSGTNRQSIEQLEPFIRHIPADTARVLANLLDWKLRGNSGRAGIEGTDPTSLKMQDVETAITKANPEHMIAMTGGSPEVLSNLRDIGQIAHNENIRPGKRTVPGGPGSTIGSLAMPGLGTIGGLIHGLTANPGALGGDLGALLMAAVSGVGGFAAGEAGTYGLGKLLTNPRLTEAIANPVNSVATGVRRAVQGASAEAAHKSQKGKADEDQSLEEELGRRYVK